jgi:nucleotide-binding universal stress UspA family protein
MSPEPQAHAEPIAIAVRPDGRAVAVYTDAVPFEALGRVTAMPRASRVEWDAAAQEWVARDACTDDVVAHGRSRDAVLREEHAHYVDALVLGTRPRSSGESS